MKMAVTQTLLHLFPFSKRFTLALVLYYLSVKLQQQWRHTNKRGKKKHGYLKKKKIWLKSEVRAGSDFLQQNVNTKFFPIKARMSWANDKYNSTAACFWQGDLVLSMYRVVAVPDRQKMSNVEVWGGNLPPHASLYPAYPSTGVHILSHLDNESSKVLMNLWWRFDFDVQKSDHSSYLWLWPIFTGDRYVSFWYHLSLRRPISLLLHNFIVLEKSWSEQFTKLVDLYRRYDHSHLCWRSPRKVLVS